MGVRDRPLRVMGAEELSSDSAQEQANRACKQDHSVNPIVGKKAGVRRPPVEQHASVQHCDRGPSLTEEVERQQNLKVFPTFVSNQGSLSKSLSLPLLPSIVRRPSEASPTHAGAKPGTMKSSR